MTKKVKTRLLVNGLIFLALLSLAGLTLYFFPSDLVFSPLLLALVSAIPAGIIIDELRRLPQIKNPQQPHYRPQGSGK